MGSRRSSLLVRFGVIFFVFAVVTLAITGLATYAAQVRAYHREQVQKLQGLASYLSVVLREDGDEFPLYQRYFLEHRDSIDVPVDFDLDDVPAAHEGFTSAFVATYPGKALGTDVDPSDMASEVQHAYAIYSHERYLSLFEEADTNFDLA